MSINCETALEIRNSIELKPTLTKLSYKPENLEDLVLVLVQFLRIYAGPEYWKIEPVGELPHQLAKNLHLNFRPSNYTEGWSFACEALLAVKRFKHTRTETDTSIPANEKQVGGDHYKKGEHQHWDRMWEMYREAWFVGNITKYAERYREKNGIEDIDKIIHYAQKLKELELKDLEKKDGTTDSLQD